MEAEPFQSWTQGKNNRGILTMKTSRFPFHNFHVKEYQNRYPSWTMIINEPVKIQDSYVGAEVRSYALVHWLVLIAFSVVKSFARILVEFSPNGDAFYRFYRITRKQKKIQ